MSRFRTGDDVEILDSQEALSLLQRVLLEAVEGARDDDIADEYQKLRTWVLGNSHFKNEVPRFLRQNRDIPSFWSYIKSYNPQWEPRRLHVRESLAPLFDIAEADEASKDTTFGRDVASSGWTGVTGSIQKAQAVRALIPVTRSAIENLIQHLELPGGNGGPPLDDHLEAIRYLKELHRILGQLLEEVEQGNLVNLEGGGLVVEAAKYAKRSARILKSDPMPYAVAGLTLAVFTACGWPGVGGYLGGVALNMRKNSSNET
ncbi:MAG: hypothetical protein ABL882_05325 [Sphingopyxis sp.]